MEIRDLEMAKRELKKKSLSLAIVKDGEMLFESFSHGISGFLQAIEKLGERLEGASVADKIVGRAIALLCVYAEVKAVYAEVLSEEAKTLFERCSLYYEYNIIVGNVLTSNTKKICPFENVAKQILNPKEAYEKLKRLYESINVGKMMGEEDKQFISEEDKELERIKERKLKQLLARRREKKIEMPNKPIHVTDANFNEIIGKNSLALIDFWASWCGPCRALAPTIEELAQEYGKKVLVGKLNVDENPKTAERFQIFSIPTLLIMKNGREVDRIVGLVPKKHIEALLKKHME